MNKIKRILPKSIRTKMIVAFCLPTILLFFVNLMLYVSTSRMTASLNEVYASNNTLNELNNTLDNLQESMTNYLDTKTSDFLEQYYIYEQDYANLVDELDDALVDSETKVMERNIKKMSNAYIQLTNQAIDSKRGGNVEKYKTQYEDASNLYGYISNSIYSLNNKQFINNTTIYSNMMSALQSLEAVNIITLIVISIGNMVFVVLIASTITEPLVKLSSTANKVAKGNFDVELLDAKGNDEIGVVTLAFNKMIVSIRDYISRLTESMENERQLKENELKMENHLKDAELRYLQAQINPHFLFNTLNAGAQLAMMEGAESSSRYIQRVADFFRYNIKKNHDVVTLADEIEMVDIYIYILNVRFAGEIRFEKEIDESLLSQKLPSMILQPIVENSVNYGIRNIDWTKKIKLSVYRIEDLCCVSIADNGIGIEQDVIDKILSGNYHGNPDKADSNGVGLDNCISRLGLYFGQDEIMDIISEGKNKGTETILYLPIQGKKDV